MSSVSTPGRRRVAEALWRTIARSGIAGVSVRAVAAEASVTGGTVQHHFPTRGEMIRFAMELIAEQVEERLVSMPRTGPVAQWTRSILLELLPLSPERRQEFDIWLAFTVHADTDPDLGELKRRTSARLLGLYRNIAIARWGDGDTNARLLQAIIDGLSLQLAQMDLEQASIAGPRLLDAYLAGVDHRTALG